MVHLLKTVIDRFYANNDALHKSIKSALILTFAEDTLESAEGAIASYKGMIGYLGWKNVSIITALACHSLEDIKMTDFPQKAYELGKSL